MNHALSLFLALLATASILFAVDIVVDSKSLYEAFQEERKTLMYMNLEEKRTHYYQGCMEMYMKIADKDLVMKTNSTVCRGMAGKYE